MKRVLIIGDTHIPECAENLPEKFWEEVEKSDKVLCTGDITDQDVLDRMMELSDVRVVGGEDDWMKLPQQDVVQVEEVKMGLIHGHQLGDLDFSDECEDRGRTEKLVELAGMLSIEVLVTGHTHKPFRTEKDGVVLLNPGTATGAGKEGEEHEKTCLVIQADRGDITDSEMSRA